MVRTKRALVWLWDFHLGERFYLDIEVGLDRGNERYWGAYHRHYADRTARPVNTPMSDKPCDCWALYAGPFYMYIHSYRYE